MDSVALFRSPDGGTVTTHDLERRLRALGLQEGDVVFLHTELLRFGRVVPELVREPARLFDAIIGTLRAVVGPGGTLLMTTLSPKALGQGVFDVDATPSEGGVLTEHFRKLPGVVRTIHPTHSMAIQGPAAAQFQDLPLDPFGVDSLFDRLQRLQGKLLFFGADFHWCTFNHRIEDAARVPYRRHQLVPMRIRANGQERRVEAFRFTKSDRFRIDFSAFRNVLLQRGILREERSGPGYLALAPTDTLFAAGLEQLRRDRYFFLRVTPLHVHWKQQLRSRVGALLRSVKGN